jgi:hypothetical protein
MAWIMFQLPCRHSRRFVISGVAVSTGEMAVKKKKKKAKKVNPIFF